MSYLEQQGRCEPAPADVREGASRLAARVGAYYAARLLHVAPDTLGRVRVGDPIFRSTAARIRARLCELGELQ